MWVVVGNESFHHFRHVGNQEEDSVLSLEAWPSVPCMPKSVANHCASVYKLNFLSLFWWSSAAFAEVRD